ncbi:dihydrolipoyl dehydrogenase family protein [Aquipuribacter hungaricus]|uniref:Dihydrolipoyl dehydrogenase family protein n=1 Tax=Aquipuribacter hungaricus TaxID=545624 RepID=A0ABV7WIP3_9MICO
MPSTPSPDAPSRPADQDTEDVGPGGDVEQFDLVVLGVGSGGEVVAATAARRGLRVAAVEARLLGGECPFLACVPSKVMLLAASRARAAGTDLRAAFADAVRARDEAAQHLDDSSQADELAEAGVVVVRGRGTVTGPGRLSVRPDGDGDVRELAWGRALVVGTGSQPVVPDLPGLDEVPTWTSDQALTSDELPGRLLVLGGGPVGCELSQVYASFGTEVTLVETSPHLLPSEDPWVGEALQLHLEASGVRVLVATTLVGVEPADGGARARLEPASDGSEGSEGSDGSEVVVDRVLVVTGRAPSGDGLGLDLLGVAVSEKGAVEVDDRCRALDADGSPVAGVLAVGDVTGLAPYTHTANHQARVVTAGLAGRDVRVRSAGIPRAVYTDPPVFSVGLGEEAAREAGHDVLVAHQDVGETGRAFVEQLGVGTADQPDPGPSGVRLVCDRDGTLLGAAAVGPHADSWGGELALAVTAGLDVRLLAEHTRAFPTWSEAITPAAQDLAARTGEDVS